MARHAQLLASAIHDWIEDFYNPCLRYSSLAMRSPVEYELASKSNILNNTSKVG
jgi:hypothetical protein